MIHLLGLGHAIITVGATRLTPASETLFAAALFFVSEAGRPVDRRRLMDLLWPNVTAPSANHCLRQTVYRLNAFGAGLRSDRGHIVLEPRLAQSDCAELLVAGDAIDPDRVAELVQGPFLSGYTPHISAPFSAWLEHQRDIVTAGLRRVLVSAIGAKRERNDWTAAERLAARCLLLDPLNEEATLAVAEAAAVHGSKVRALEILDGYLRELGPDAGDIRLPATLLRRRIAERYRRDPSDRRELAQVGREDEMRELGRVLRGLRAQTGDTYLIWGEEGIGKTRLTTELSRSTQFDGAKVIRVECQPNGEQRPLSAFADMVPRLRTLRGAIAIAESSNRYLELLHGCDHGEGANEIQRQQAKDLHRNVRHALLDLIDAVAHEQPLILILEDVHWLDDASWEIVRVLTQWVRKRRVFLLLTSRHCEITRRFGTEAEWRPASLRLKPLDDTASHLLVGALVEGTEREGNVQFAEWCVLRAGGNPYYLSELGRHADGGRGQFQAPISLERLVDHRLVGLSAVAIRLLQTAAVLGRAATTDILEEVLGAPRLSLLAGFDELSAAGLIDLRLGIVTVRHHLIADAALARLSTAARQLLHRHAAELLDRDRSTDSSAALLWECAEHWQQAGEQRRALELLASCARHLIDIGMPCEAARMHERAAELAPTSSEKLHHLASRAHALFLGASWTQFLRAATELDSLKRRCQLDDHDDTELELSLAKWRLGHDRRDLLADSLRCAAAAGASGAHRLQAATWALMLADNQCDNKAALAVLKAITPVLKAAADDDLGVAFFEMVYHCAFGTIVDGLGAARRLVRAQRDLPDSEIKAKHLSHAAAALRSCGAPLSEARAAAAQALEIAERLGIAAYAAPAANQMLLAFLADGEMTSAREWFDKARKLVESSSDTAGRSTTLSNGAEIALLDGRLDEAQRLIEESERLVDLVPSPRSEMRYLSFRWRLTLLRGRAEPSDHDLRLFLQLHRRTRRASGQDSATAALLGLLLSRGRRREASKVLRDYLFKHRHAGVPIEAELKRIAFELGLHDGTDR